MYRLFVSGSLRSPPPRRPHRLAVISSGRDRTLDRVQLEQGGGKRVVRPEHHCWADKRGVLKGGPHRQFAFAPLADIKRRRGSIRTDSRNGRRGVRIKQAMSALAKADIAACTAHVRFWG